MHAVTVWHIGLTIPVHGEQESTLTVYCVEAQIAAETKQGLMTRTVHCKSRLPIHDARPSLETKCRHSAGQEHRPGSPAPGAGCLARPKCGRSAPYRITTESNPEPNDRSRKAKQRCQPCSAPTCASLPPSLHPPGQEVDRIRLRNMWSRAHAARFILIGLRSLAQAPPAPQLAPPWSFPPSRCGPHQSKHSDVASASSRKCLNP